MRQGIVLRTAERRERRAPRKISEAGGVRVLEGAREGAIRDRSAAEVVAGLRVQRSGAYDSPAAATARQRHSSSFGLEVLSPRGRNPRPTECTGPTRPMPDVCSQLLFSCLFLSLLRETPCALVRARASPPIHPCWPYRSGWRCFFCRCGGGGRAARRRTRSATRLTVRYWERWRATASRRHAEEEGRLPGARARPERAKGKSLYPIDRD